MRPAEQAVQLLATVHAAAASGMPLPPAAAAWLLDGIRAHVLDGAELGDALQLAGAGQRSTRRLLQQLVRDRHLVHALEAVDPAGTLDQWARCRALAKVLPGFVAVVWPRVRLLAAAPDGWPLYRRELFAAARAGVPLPTSARQLHRIVTRAPAYSCHDGAGTLLERLL